MSLTQSSAETYPLLRTKLNRPRVSRDLVHRPQLLERLDQRRQRPFTLVSAPAGYGKTTLVSSWLETCDWPSAWLSLDEDDNDLGLFLTYLLAAIQTIFPGACADTLSLLTATTLPPLPILVRTLINELDQIKEPFILALDDYHLIQNMDVHELIGELLAHPPRPVHLVLASRVDPPLNLTRYRARRQVTEIRTHELRFNETETAAFLQHELGTPTDDRTIDALLRQVEGWVTGLRLVTLSLRHRGVEELVPTHLQGGVSYITEYLMGEVLDSQPTAIQEYLLHTSILDRLCAPLCGAVAVNAESAMDGERFLEWLTTANLFVTRLDEEGQWYRYHQLFRGALRDLLAKRLGSDDIAALHKRASFWLAQNGLIDEALRHALAAGDTSAAVDLVVEHRHEPLNEERGQRLERWLNLLPVEAIEQEPQLLLAEAWLKNNRLKFGEMVPLVERAAAILEGDDTALTAKERKELGGEIAALRCVPLTWMGQGQLALELVRHAIDVTPIEHEWVRGIALTFYPVALFLAGHRDRAYEEMHKILAQGSVLTMAFRHRAHVSLVTVEVLAGNLSGAEEAARQLQNLSEPRRLYDSLGWVNYSLGFVHYQRNDLAQAKHHFEQLVEMRYLGNAGAAAQAHYGLALTYQAMGKPDQARKTHQSALAWAAETGDAGMLIEAESLGSRLALLHGQVPDVARWANMLGDSVLLMLLLHIPQLTLANVLLAEGTPEALLEANDLLAWLRQSAQATHNTWRLMEITAMQAILKESQGERQAALALLKEVLAWAEPRGYIRLFADLGPRMAFLLNQLYRQGIAPGYIAQILAAFPTETKDPSTGLRAGERPRTKGFATPFVSRLQSPRSKAEWDSSTLVDPLTNREMEVLELLAQGFSNKQIAAQLVLTLGSVKQYTHRIYRKLHVKNRQQAVITAGDLGILRSATE